MEIFSYLWNNYLYVPGFNLLILTYLNFANFNLGTAIIIITVMLRITLLPFSIMEERGKLNSQEAAKEISDIRQSFKNDPVKLKEMIREALKRRKIYPWAKAISLIFQALVLLLLYQIFLGGINTEEKIHLLYPGVPRPDFINTNFLGLDLAQHNLSLAIIVGIYLFVSIMFSFWQRGFKVSKREQIFSILFPVSIAFALSLLPSVKSLFVLTSLAISTIISMFTLFIKLTINKAKQG